MYGTTSTCSRNKLQFAAPHGFVDGQEVTYANSGGGSLGGLSNGETYFVIVSSPSDIQLATIAGWGARWNRGRESGGSARASGSLNGLSFSPFDDINPDGSIRLPGHGLSTGDQVTFAGLPSFGDLVDGEDYFAIVDGDSIRLASSPDDAISNLANVLFESLIGSSDTHRLIYEETPQALDPTTDLDNETDSIVLGSPTRIHHGRPGCLPRR